VGFCTVAYGNIFPERMQILSTLLRIYFIRVGGVFPKTLEMSIEEQPTKEKHD